MWPLIMQYSSLENCGSIVHTYEKSNIFEFILECFPPQIINIELYKHCLKANDGILECWKLWFNNSHTQKSNTFLVILARLRTPFLTYFPTWHYNWLALPWNTCEEFFVRILGELLNLVYIEKWDFSKKKWEEIPCAGAWNYG